jgi:hypothetical protein
VGLPWPGSLSGVQDIGRQDAICAALGLAAAVGALVAASAWNPTRPLRAIPSAFVGTAVLALSLTGLTAPHAYAHGSDSQVHAHGTAAAGPIISLDDARLTSSQRDEAAALIERTKRGLAALADQAALEAAGYFSIGDGRSGFEHWINAGYLLDSTELDENHIESVVMTVAPDGTKKVASAMYILDLGKTMADAPDIAGELTTFHNHTDLCWEGLRVVGVLRNGTCTPRGTHRGVSPPMLHVWLTPQPCGPFAGIEASTLAGDCTHRH